MGPVVGALQGHAPLPWAMLNMVLEAAVVVILPAAPWRLPGPRAGVRLLRKSYRC